MILKFCHKQKNGGDIRRRPAAHVRKFATSFAPRGGILQIPRSHSPVGHHPPFLFLSTKNPYGKISEMIFLDCKNFWNVVIFYNVDRWESG